MTAHGRPGGVALTVEATGSTGVIVGNAKADTTLRTGPDSWRGCSHGSATHSRRIARQY
jgi:hypothetical protein